MPVSNPKKTPTKFSKHEIFFLLPFDIDQFRSRSQIADGKNAIFIKRKELLSVEHFWPHKCFINKDKYLIRRIGNLLSTDGITSHMNITMSSYGFID